MTHGQSAENPLRYIYNKLLKETATQAIRRGKVLLPSKFEWDGAQLINETGEELVLIQIDPDNNNFESNRHIPDKSGRIFVNVGCDKLDKRIRQSAEEAASEGKVLIYEEVDKDRCWGDLTSASLILGEINPDLDEVPLEIKMALANGWRVFETEFSFYYAMPPNTSLFLSIKRTSTVKEMMEKIELENSNLPSCAKVVENQVNPG